MVDSVTLSVFEVSEKQKPKETLSLKYCFTEHVTVHNLLLLLLRVEIECWGVWRKILTINCF